MDPDDDLSSKEAAKARALRVEAEQLHRIKRSPLSADESAMFDMFERECWPHACRRAYILSRFLRRDGITAPC